MKLPSRSTIGSPSRSTMAYVGMDGSLPDAPPSLLITRESDARNVDRVTPLASPMFSARYVFGLGSMVDRLEFSIGDRLSPKLHHHFFNDDRDYPVNVRAAKRQHSRSVNHKRDAFGQRVHVCTSAGH